tara:strand:- start:822 stop:1112 length:291 start_codon:yes stop_codon:yes gene_type:complete
MNDKIVKAVKARLKLGQKKYGNDLTDMDPRDWLSESTEEMLDSIVYMTAQHFRMLESRDYYFVKMAQALDILELVSKSDDIALRAKANQFLKTFKV